VLFSDGVLDLFDGTLAAIDEVALITQSAPSCEALLDQIFDLADPESLDDDITVVAVRRITIARE
jgi:sigma-B regulation protein RsbU (phosphoserine phosphatase)